MVVALFMVWDLDGVHEGIFQVFNVDCPLLFVIGPECIGEVNSVVRLLDPLLLKRNPT